jgi:hypothetical protein
MKYMTLIILLLYTATDVRAQTYIQGDEVIASANILNSSLLPFTKRLSTENAFSKLKLLHPEAVQKEVSRLVGEFWLIDKMLINVVSRTVLSGKREDLKQLRYSYRPEGAGMNSLFKDKYHDEVKAVSNFEVMTYYLRDSNVKSFIIYDNQSRYVLRGSITSTKEDSAKAEAFMDTLLKSITFK